MSQIVFQKDWFAVFKVKVTVKDQLIKIWLSNRSSELLTLLQRNLVWWHINISWLVFWRYWIALLSKSRAQKRFKVPVNVHLDDISSTAEPSVVWWCIIMGQSVMQAECHARRLVCCLQVQGHSEGSYNQVWLFLPYLQSNQPSFVANGSAVQKTN